MGNQTKADELNDKIEQAITDDSCSAKKPFIAIVTFQALAGHANAQNLFAKKEVTKEDSFVNQAENKNYSGFIFTQAGSPHSYRWENQEVSALYRGLVGFAVFTILLVYLAFCFRLSVYIKDILVNRRFDFQFAYACDTFDEMFKDDVSEYNRWARLDWNHVKNQQSTGIYECYCSSRISISTFWYWWTNPESYCCGKYMKNGFGGQMLTLPSGILNAFLTNFGSILAIKLIPLIRVKSNNTQQHMIVFSVFIISYLNMGLFILYQYGSDSRELLDYDIENHKHDIYEALSIPHNFTSQWLVFWGKAISTSLIISNLMPYVGPMMKLLCQRGICCCKRKNYKMQRNLNPEFNMERRYAGILNTLFLVCTYAFSMPVLPLISTGVIIFQYIVDKIQITYFWKERVEQNDFLNRSTLRAMQFGIVIFFGFSAWSLAANYCTVNNKPDAYLFVATEFLECFQFTDSSYHLLGIGGGYLVLLMIFWYFFSDRRQQTKFYQKVAEKEQNYFGRISDSDRKRWIASEYFRRERYGIQMLTDDVLEKMKKQVGRCQRKSNDPPGYEILSNSQYVNKFQYQALLLADQDPKQMQISDQITRALYSQYCFKKTEQETTGQDEVEYTEMIQTSIQ